MKPPTNHELWDRFWAKVDKNGPTEPHMDTNCWLWTAATSAKRAPYGVIRIPRGKTVLAHRLSYEWEYGEHPPMVDHICLVHRCVRPDHLRGVTNKQNLENRRGPTSRSRSGVRGVYFDHATGRWAASVRHNGTDHWCGRFSSKEAADEAVTAKRLELFTFNELDKHR